MGYYNECWRESSWHGGGVAGGGGDNTGWEGPGMGYGSGSGTLVGGSPTDELEGY